MDPNQTLNHHHPFHSNDFRTTPRTASPVRYTTTGTNTPWSIHQAGNKAISASQTSTKNPAYPDPPTHASQRAAFSSYGLTPSAPISAIGNPAAPPHCHASLQWCGAGIAGRSPARARDCVVAFAEGAFSADVAAKVCAGRAGRPVGAVRMAVSPGSRAGPSQAKAVLG